ncbi:MAG: hypothetical protein F6K28_54385 [Microcoleus sp. SIO2G3]|nr:hypothetical protein [Microcoleus sp. SIO2G3]
MSPALLVGFPDSQATGESSPAGGFPAVGNWRTRRALGNVSTLTEEDKGEWETR